MAEPKDMILPLLREIRADMAKRFDTVDAHLVEHDRGLSDVRKRLDSLRQAMVGDTVLGRILIDEVEERFEAIERLAVIEKSR